MHSATSFYLRREFAEIAPLFKPGTLERVCAHLDEPGRAYHNATHIRNLFWLLGRLRGQAKDPAALKSAIFFHDAIYVIPRDAQQPPVKNNELKSVELMQELAISPTHPSLVKAGAMILCTAGHARQDDPDIGLMLDLDLSILAASPARFARFERAVRREYEVYPLPLYCMARMGVLRGFLDPIQLFNTPGLAKLWQPRAERNLHSALKALGQGQVLQPA
jgi:predicted metal-dependent HD superfamily phosphohydrolase